MAVKEGYMEARMEASWSRRGPDGRDYLLRLRDLGLRVDRVVEAAARGDRQALTRALNGFDAVGDEAVMGEAIARRRDAGAPDPGGLLASFARNPTLAAIADAELDALARRARDATASRGDEAHFLHHQRHYVTRDDLARALAIPRGGMVAEAPIATLLAHADDAVAFHVPPKAARDGTPAQRGATFKGRVALQALRDGFGERNTLRSLDVSHMVIPDITRSTTRVPLGAAVLEACSTGLRAMRERTLSIVVADHVQARSKGRETPTRDGDGMAGR